MTNAEGNGGYLKRNVLHQSFALLTMATIPAPTFQQPGSLSRPFQSIDGSASSLAESELQSARNLFAQIRQNPQSIAVLWDCGSKSNVEICKKIILQHIFPEDSGHGSARQFAQLLYLLFEAEVSGSSDLKYLLRGNSLACVLSAAYGRGRLAESFARELFDPIFVVTLCDPSIRIGSTSESYDVALLNATLKKAVVALCSRMHELPLGFACASSAILTALRSHPLNEDNKSLSATSAVGAIVFLRYIVPFVIQYGQGRQPVAQTFFIDLGSTLQKVSNGSTFASNHKHASMNATIEELASMLAEAFMRLSSFAPPAPAQATFVDYTEPLCSIDAAELNAFVSLLSSLRTTTPLPSSVPDLSVSQALHQLQIVLSRHAATFMPPRVPSIAPSAGQASAAAPRQSAPDCPKHIMDDSSFVSRATFWWCNDLFKLGYSAPLTADDLWPAPPRTLCSSSVQIFEKAWNLESSGDSAKAQKPGMRLFKAAFKCFGHLFLTSIVLKTVWMGCALALPAYFLRQIISFANNPEEPLQNGILYAVFMFVAQLTSVTCLHNQVLVVCDMASAELLILCMVQKNPSATI